MTTITGVRPWGGGTRTNSVRLNFYHWCKTPSSAFSKKIQRRPPIFCTFSVEPLVILLYFVQLKTLAPSTRYSTFKYPVTFKPRLGSLKVIESYTSRSGTHDFLLTFHSKHRPISRRLRDKRQLPSKIANFAYSRAYIAPDERVPLGIWYRRKGSQMRK